nr:MAG TPA: hypothetical protein [Caudoviricetes sp.]
MANNVDFTNERPYDQNEHARALKSACANRIDGMNYSNEKIESGYGIIFGSPFQVDATQISGSGYITINIELSEIGNAGIGNVSITKESTRQNVDNGNVKKYSIYQVDGTKVINDYRYSDIIKDIELGGSGNKVHFNINGVKSNDYTLPITTSGSVDLSNYYTKNEVDTKDSKVLENVTNFQNTSWKNISGGFYGGKDINLTDNLWTYDFIVFAYGDAEYATVDLRIIRALNNIKRGGSGIVKWNFSSANINGGNPLYRAMSLQLRDRAIACTGSTVFNAGNKAISTNNGDYAITKYALVKISTDL